MYSIKWAMSPCSVKPSNSIFKKPRHPRGFLILKRGQQHGDAEHCTHKGSQRSIDGMGRFHTFWQYKGKPR